MNVGFSVVVLDSLTGGPLTWVHRTDCCPVAFPARVTTWPRVLTWSGPASARTPSGGVTSTVLDAVLSPAGPVTFKVTVAAALTVSGVQVARPGLFGSGVTVPSSVVQS